MEKLALSDYSFIQSFLEELPFTPTFAYSVLDHFIDGDVYVNSRNNITGSSYPVGTVTLKM
ncbi:hypothetical protein ACFYKX_23765 [Cytobacillus sp. FJAT-54145]|uniref:Uncharacterized protein n=1 Tax=Cytobacillus spartinae TaxID=3299023 RepID=A0ABW6KHC4_9BACI